MRRAILDRLREGAQPVHELASDFPISRPAVSRHLRLLKSAGLSVVIAGDAAMTCDFFFARDWYFNTVDPEQAVQSIDAIARIAHIVVPGHDNYFVARPVAGQLAGQD